jgi:NAD(P)-dependent dehydrogenase (short-subunit alcohol dehydrogenase family)
MYGLTPTLKNEIVSIAPRGRVNSVNPGWVATPLAAKTLKDTKFVERALATTPLQKVGMPQDIANQVCVLASPVLSGHVNGVNLQVGKFDLKSIFQAGFGTLMFLFVDGGMEGRLLFPPSQ